MSNGPEENNQFKAGFGRTWVSVRGKDAFVVLLILLLAGCFAYLIYLCLDTTKTARQLKDQHDQIEAFLTDKDVGCGKIRDQITRVVKENADAQSVIMSRQDTIIYMLSLSDRERANLNINMPKTLRDLLSRNRER